MLDDDKQTEEAVAEAEEKVEEAQEKAEEAKEAVEEAKEAIKEVKEETQPAASAKEEKPKADVKVSKKLQDLISEIEKLSVLELADLVKALEDRFGVTAAAPMAIAQAPGSAGADSSEGVSEQTTFNVILASSGANKISVIKAVRELVQTLGLKEAKDLVDAAPKEVLAGVNKENATEAKQKLEAAGATVELK